MPKTESAPTLEQSAARVRQAKRGGDAAALADALVDYANALGQVARFEEARDALDEAADNYRALHRTEDEATCTLFAAGFARLLFDVEGVYKRGAYVSALMPPNHPLTQSAYLEMAEMAMVSADTGRAVQFYDRALKIAESTEASPETLAGLHGKRARAHLGNNAFDEARDDLVMAIDLLHEIGSQARVVGAVVELATLLTNMGSYDDALSYVADAEQIAVEVLADPPDEQTRHDMMNALADISLVRTSVALFRKDLHGGFEQAQIARERALDAVHPVAYIGAVINLSRLYDLAGDRINAYAMLATGYVTLGDILGDQAALSTFEPSFQAIRDKWGVEAFNEVRAEYEAQRRQV